MTIPIHEDDVMKHVRQPRGLRIVRVIPIDMDVPISRRDVDVCSPQRPANVRWLLRNLAVRNKNHPQFEKTMKKLKIMASQLQKEI